MSSFSNYSSGEFPRYTVGHLVKIKWRIGTEQVVMGNAEVFGGSESNDADSCSGSLPTL
jgi:hypothetical protein